MGVTPFPESRTMPPRSVINMRGAAMCAQDVFHLTSSDSNLWLLVQTMRTSTACAQCRLAKRRCTRHEPSEACAPCQQKQLLCEGKLQNRPVGHRFLVSRPYTATGSTFGQYPKVPEPQVGPRPDLSRGTAIELVDHYLDKFHGTPHTIFHPATLQSSVQDGTINKALLYAICAIGCKFSGNPDTRCQGSALAAESKRLLQADISNISLENIQSCILVAMLSVGHGDSASEALFFRTYTIAKLL